jgi:Leucine-rich repeat (LRR) protein
MPALSIDFWIKNVRPKTIFYRHERTNSDRLSIACTQTGDLSHQRRVVNQWCEILPSLDHVRVLWFQSKVSQQLFDAACQMPNLEGLWAHFSSVKDLANIVKAKSLRHLYMGSSPGIQSIEPLAQMSQLETLRLVNLKRISDLSPLASLKRLQALSFKGGLWSIQKVKSLEPLSALASLKLLDVGALQTLDESLKPLGSLRGLRQLWVSMDKYPIEEIAWLSAKNPRLRLKPYAELGGHGVIYTCKRCKSKDPFVLLMGKGARRQICKVCNADKLARHVAYFSACVEAFSRE